MEKSRCFLSILEERGFLHQCTHREEMVQFFAEKPRKVYIGFDATADSLHVGSLLPLMVLRWAYLCGHHPVVLLGGGTTQVGDPSEKDETRKILDLETIDRFSEGICKSIGSILPLNDPNISVLNNKDWLPSLSYLPFLREIGAHFSVNAMLSFESVKRRLDREQPLSFLEFNYMLCQAYDFLFLAEKHDCFVQAGGSDQWGNIVSGVDLIRRKINKKSYGFTMPLLQNSKGAKMGKTVQGAVWLSPEKLKPYDYWQYWRNVTDEDVERFLRLFTMLSLEEISDVMAQNNPNTAKKTLANAATALLHGEESLQDILKTVRHLEETDKPFFVEGFDAKNNAIVKTELDIFPLPYSNLREPRLLVDLVHEAQPSLSKSHVRRVMREGGVYLDGQRVEDIDVTVFQESIKPPFLLHVKIGKKQHILIQVMHEDNANTTSK